MGPATCLAPHRAAQAGDVHVCALPLLQTRARCHQPLPPEPPLGASQWSGCWLLMFPHPCLPPFSPRSGSCWGRARPSRAAAHRYGRLPVPAGLLRRINNVWWCLDRAQQAGLHAASRISSLGRQLEAAIRHFFQAGSSACRPRADLGTGEAGGHAGRAHGEHPHHAPLSMGILGIPISPPKWAKKSIPLGKPYIHLRKTHSGDFIPMDQPRTSSSLGVRPRQS